MFLHRVRVMGEIDVKTFDLYSTREWVGLAKEMRLHGFSAAEYGNKYEPDLSPSYFVVEEGVIELLSVEIVSSYQAEKEIDKFSELMDSFH